MAKKEEAPRLVVESSMKDFVGGFSSEGTNMRSSGELGAAVNAKVAAMLEEAVNRAVTNGRKTVCPHDL